MRFILSRCRTRRIIIFSLSALITFIYVYVVYMILKNWLTKEQAMKFLSINLPYVVVHIDLKGAPLKLTYLETVLPSLKKHGANGLLMEYEDTFPYEGDLINISSTNHYQKSELTDFISLAVQTGFEVIPLIQTFGHLEHVLKLEEYQNLREDPQYPDSICPSKDKSITLLRNMLEQVIKFHNAIKPLKHIHIGCDEVYHINKCKYCAQRKISSGHIFLDHINTIKKIVKSLSPDVTVLIWDDMLRKIVKKEDINPSRNIEPVYWTYSASLDLSYINMFIYTKKFDNIWIASAYKGADGRLATLPNLRIRYMNHYNWLNFIVSYRIAGENTTYNFKGIILTGWSRYSHMEPPCETFPISFPSLILNLMLIQQFKLGFFYGDNINNSYDIFYLQYLEKEISNYLECDHVMNLDNFDSLSCAFDGKDLYTLLQKYLQVNKKVEIALHSDDTGLLTMEYYLKLGKMKMGLVHKKLQWCNETLEALLNMENSIYSAMIRYYDNNFVEEYITYKTYNVKQKLYSLLRNLRKYTYIRTWPRDVFISNITIPNK